MRSDHQVTPNLAAAVAIQSSELSQVRNSGVNRTHEAVDIRAGIGAALSVPLVLVALTSTSPPITNGPYWTLKPAWPPAR